MHAAHGSPLPVHDGVRGRTQLPSLLPFHRVVRRRNDVRNGAHVACVPRLLLVAARRRRARGPPRRGTQRQGTHARGGSRAGRVVRAPWGAQPAALYRRRHRIRCACEPPGLHDLAADPRTHNARVYAFHGHPRAGRGPCRGK
eukprot:Amastigsp_a843013_16.p3 type:complete len:143 gc:universal Amastigsp_a843013_16:716-288(-)